MEMIDSMGGAATPLSFGELYSALDQGVVDGAENNPPSLLSSRHYEVCKFYSLDEHTMVPDVVLIVIAGNLESTDSGSASVASTGGGCIGAIPKGFVGYQNKGNHDRVGGGWGGDHPRTSPFSSCGFTARRFEGTEAGRWMQRVLELP